MITFNLNELLALPEMFPPRGTIQDNIAVKSIREKCELTEADYIAIGHKRMLTEKGMMSTWSVEKAAAITRDVCFSANEIDLLKGRVTAMDDKKEISERTLDVVLKIRDVSKEQATAKEVK